MPDALEIVKAKIALAERDALDLGASINAVTLHAGPDEIYRLTPELDLDRAKCRFRVQKVAEPPIAEWEAKLGCVLHSLRSALDQLAYQLAVLNSPSKDPPAGTEFPIFLDHEKFRAKGKGSGTYKIRGMAPEVHVLIESLQPYDTPENPLWVLQQLSNSDKHRIGFKAAASVGLPVMQGPVWTGLRPLNTGSWTRRPYEDGVIIATFDVEQTLPNPKVNVKFKPTFSVTLDEGIGRRPRPFGLVVPELLNKVSGTIQRFEPFFQP